MAASCEHSSNQLGSIVIPNLTAALAPLTQFFAHGRQAHVENPYQLEASWLALKECGCDLGADWRQLPTSELWAAHDVALAAWRSGQPGRAHPSLLALKRHLAYLCASPCHLCALHCGAQRQQGLAGACGSADVTRLAAPVLQEGEEFGRCLVLSPTGCNADCDFCYAHQLISANAGQPGRRASVVALLASAHKQGALNQNWIGGNPDQHLPFVFDVLAGSRTPLPVVWTANGAASAETMALLDGVVAAYVLTLRFGNDRCAAAGGGRVLGLASCTATVARALAQGVPVVVRVLALPGHLGCCGRPILEWLGSRNEPGLLVNLLHYQYFPSYRARGHAVLGRQLTAEEQATFTHWAEELGIRRLDICTGETK